MAAPKRPVRRSFSKLRAASGRSTTKVVRRPPAKPGPAPTPPPSDEFYIITESSDPIITEGSTQLVTEGAP